MTLPTRALSFKQPWMHFVIDPSVPVPKRLDNRSRRIMNWREWNPPGAVWLHAGKGDDAEYWAQAIEWVRRMFGSDFPVPRFADVPRGGIVGRARIVGIISPSGEVDALESELIGSRPNFAGGFDRRWHATAERPLPGETRPQFAYMLADVIPVPFVECRGQLGFWPVPARTLADLMAER